MLISKVARLVVFRPTKIGVTSGRAALAALMLLGVAGADGPALTQVTVTATPAQTLQGWGMSLAWEGNDIFGSPVMAAKLPDPVQQNRYMDLVFGDPASGPGLG